MICEHCGVETKSEVRKALDKLNHDPSIKLFESCGVDCFSVYGASGGVTRLTIAYLTRGDKAFAFYVDEDAEASVRKALAEFNAKAHRVGTDMGMPSSYETK